jgi:SDR family mycofactocin-dependent oxidoreductase
MGQGTSGLDGAVVVVTGAGRGQGRNHCVRLAEAGASVIAIDVCAPIEGVDYPMATTEDLAETARLVESAGGRATTFVADVRDLKAMVEAIDAGVAALGGLDGIVANAGICAVGSTTEFSPALFQTVIDVNLVGAWNTCRAAIPHLLDGGGSIVLISSSSGIKAMPFFGAYSAAKHGLVGLMQSIGLELAESSIRVNTVHPTGVDTEMTRGLGALGPLLERQPSLGPVFMNALPMATVTPDDVSNAVLFLLSEDAAAVTGLTMTVDAGITLR